MRAPPGDRGLRPCRRRLGGGMLGRVSAAPTSLLAPAPGYDPALGIQPPRLRRGTVRRDRLVRMLVQSADIPLVLVRAPAGYGKTTLLSQWSERDGRPFVWADPELGGGAVRARARRARRSTPSTARRSWCWTGRCCARTRRGPGADPRRARRVAGRARRSRRAGAAAREPARARPGHRGRPGRARDDAPRGRRDAQHGRRRARSRRPRRAAAPHRGLARRALPRRALAARPPRPAPRRRGLRRRRPARRRLPARRGADAAPGIDRLVPDPHVDPRPAVGPDLRRRARLRRLGRGAARPRAIGHPARAARPDGLRVPPPRAAGRDAPGRAAPRASRRAARELHRRAGAWHEHEGDVAPALEHAIEAGDVRAAGRCLWTIAGARVADGARRGGARVARALPARAAVRGAGARAHRGDGAPRRRRPRPRRALGRDRRSGCSRPSRSRRPRPRRPSSPCARSSRATGWRRWRATPREPTRSHPRTARGGRCARCCAAPGLHLLGDREGARAPLEEGARRGGIVAPIAQVLCLSQLALIAVDEDDWEQAALLSSRARAQVERGPLAELSDVRAGLRRLGAGARAPRAGRGGAGGPPAGADAARGARRRAAVVRGRDARRARARDAAPRRRGRDPHAAGRGQAPAARDRRLGAGGGLDRGLPTRRRPPSRSPRWSGPPR